MGQLGANLGPTLDRPWADLGRSRADLRRSWTDLGRSWTDLKRSWLDFDVFGLIFYYFLISLLEKKSHL